MNDMDNLNTDMEQTPKGMLAVMRRHRYSAVAAGVLASLGALIAGPAGSAVGGAVGGLIGYALDRCDDTGPVDPETNEDQEPQ